MAPHFFSVLNTSAGVCVSSPATLVDFVPGHPCVCVRRRLALKTVSGSRSLKKRLHAGCSLMQKSRLVLLQGRLVYLGMVRCNSPT